MRKFLIRIEDGTPQGKLTYFTDNMMSALFTEISDLTLDKIQFEVFELELMYDGLDYDTPILTGEKIMKNYYKPLIIGYGIAIMVTGAAAIIAGDVPFYKFLIIGASAIISTAFIQAADEINEDWKNRE